MTPNEKAFQLLMMFESHIEVLSDGYVSKRSEAIKNCALDCVDQIVSNGTQKLSDDYINYWHEVKQEIEKI